MNKATEIVFLQRGSIPNKNGKLIVTAISQNGICFHGLVTPEKDKWGRYIIPQSELLKLKRIHDKE